LWRGKINAKNYDLPAKNPNGKGEVEHKSPQEILKLIQEKESKIHELLVEVSNLIRN